LAALAAAVGAVVDELGYRLVSYKNSLLKLESSMGDSQNRMLPGSSIGMLGK